MNFNKQNKIQKINLIKYYESFCVKSTTMTDILSLD